MLSNTPCLVPGEKRFKEKKYNNADSGNGLGSTWREERCAEDFVMEAMSVLFCLETQGRGILINSHWCPWSFHGTAWIALSMEKHQASEDAEADGHSLLVADPSGDPAEVPQRRLALAEHVQGTAEPLA